MANKSIFLIILFVLSGRTFALETDNFLTWGVELEDSSEDINNYINEQLSTELALINNKKKRYTCEQVRRKLVLSFRGFITHPMEHWVESTLGPTKVYPSEESYTDREYFEMSIYGTRNFDVSKYYSLSRSINVNGVYIGTDKLSHWMSTGERYYRIYARSMKSAQSEDEAFIEAINYGIFLDRFILGGISSGVFSFGDLEANFQGLLFNRQFCRVSEGDRYLVEIDGKWIFQHEVDVKDYINPHMDETFNPSLFSVFKWKKVVENFKKQNCQKIKDQVYADRFDYYNEILKPSFSFKYIEGLKKEGRRLPPRLDRNYKNICQD